MNKHEHKECEHKNLAYCAKCNVVYCKDCGKEWVERGVGCPSTWTTPNTGWVTINYNDGSEKSFDYCP